MLPGIAAQLRQALKKVNSAAAKAEISDTLKAGGYEAVRYVLRLRKDGPDIHKSYRS